MRNTLAALVCALCLAGCASEQTASSPTIVPSETPLPPATETPVPASATPQPSPTPIPSATPAPTSTSTSTSTQTPTSTPLPAGFVLVPDVIGLHYTEARGEVARSGLTYAYRDIFDLGYPTGTVLVQDPPPGTGVRRGKIVTLYRAFQAPPALVGDICYPLRLIATSGKLIFYVDLIEDVEYEIRTDFPYGETHVSDVRMVLLDSFKNEKKDHILFTAPFTARYVISLGPYSISEDRLRDGGGSVDVGCLWVIPEEGG